MRAVIQRVSRAAVWEREPEPVMAEPVLSLPKEMPLPQRIPLGQIGRGLLVLLGIGKGDTETDADWMINKLLNLRIFPDAADKMNRSVTDISGGILVVSQFTLYGDARKGTRPSFSDAMPPAEAEKFYNEFMVKLRKATSLIVTEGKFAAMMDVELVNDGPVTIILESVTRASCPCSLDTPTEVKDWNRTGETPMLLFTSFDPATTTAIHTRRLPHWQQPGCTYFVAFRLADSLPQDKLRQWYAEEKRWLTQHPEPHDETTRAEYQQQFPDRLQQWLDAGYGACWLRRPAVAAIVEQALRCFDGQRYALGDFVIMPNHVHVLVTPLGECALEEILHSWKSFTAHEMNRLLGQTGQVWQPEHFDHLVRSAHHVEQFAAYIAQNPIKAGLHENEFRVARASRPCSSDNAHHGRDTRATD